MLCDLATRTNASSYTHISMVQHKSCYGFRRFILTSDQHLTAILLHRSVYYQDDKAS